MFRWTPAAMLRAIDLACVESLTVDEVAELVGCSRKAMFNFYRNNRALIGRARNEITVPDATYIEVMDLWDEGYVDDEISAKVGLSEDAVRRLILSAEYDEEPEGHGADAELEALREAHPDRLYEDDVRALINEPGMRLDVSQHVTPFSEDRPHRMALPAPSKRAAVTLARAA